ncbi:MAG: hypothetical protein PWQ56_497 [Patescibacteria group bacterium]|nr:hypothetical protein [Patescibacteria group bacterium]
MDIILDTWTSFWTMWTQCGHHSGQCGHNVDTMWTLGHHSGHNVDIILDKATFLKRVVSVFNVKQLLTRNKLLCGV